MGRAIRIKPLYRIDIGRCIDGKSFDIEVATIGSYASSPGRWLRNRAAAELWASWAIERNMWKSLRRWKGSRTYLI